MNNRVSKRSHQACENCRRKKTRCPGEKPACSTCTRLRQACQYNQGYDMWERSLDGDRVLENRLQQLEEKMDLMLQGSMPNRQVGTPKSYSRGPHNRENGSELSDAQDTPVPQRQLSDEAMLEDTISMSSTSPSKDIVAEGVVLYFQFCHKQPLWLFDSKDSFNPEKAHSELILSMLSLALRYSNNTFLVGRMDQTCQEYAQAARSSVMLRIAQGGVDLSTIQSLCLLALAEYIANDTHLAWLHIGIATNLAKCAGLDMELYKDESTPALEERRRVFWSIHLLNQQYAPPNMQLNMLQDIQNSKYMAPNIDSAREMGIRPPQNPQENNIISSRGGIWVYMVQLSSLWNEVQHFVSHCASGDPTPPWSVDSGYSIIGAHLMDLETKFPTVHRYDSAKFQDHSPEDLHRDRGYWSSWLYIQFTYHAVHSVLNHPFLYSWRPQLSAHLAVPNTFWKTSSELALVHSTWTIYLIGLISDKNYTISDPFLGHAVAIAATIQIYYCRAADPAVRESAQRKLETCVEFLGELAPRWPRFQVIHDKVQTLIRSAFTTSTNSNRRSSRRTLSIDTTLMWEILCHKSPTASVASPADGLFEPLFLKPPAQKEPDQEAVETEIFHHPARAVDTSDGGQALPPYSSRVQDCVGSGDLEDEVWSRNDSIPLDGVPNQVPPSREPWMWPGDGAAGDTSLLDIMDIMRDPCLPLQDNEESCRGIWKVGTF